MLWKISCAVVISFYCSSKSASGVRTFGSKPFNRLPVCLGIVFFAIFHYSIDNNEYICIYAWIPTCYRVRTQLQLRFMSNFPVFKQLASPPIVSQHFSLLYRDKGNRMQAKQANQFETSQNMHITGDVLCAHMQICIGYQTFTIDSFFIFCVHRSVKRGGQYCYRKVFRYFFVHLRFVGKIKLTPWQYLNHGKLTMAPDKAISGKNAFGTVGGNAVWQTIVLFQYLFAD